MTELCPECGADMRVWQETFGEIHSCPVKTNISLGWRKCSLCPALVPAQDIQNGLCSLCRMLLAKVKEE